MLVNFSKRYYFRPYWIQKKEGERGLIQEREYNQIMKSLDRERNELIMKLGNFHFKVEGDNKVPYQTLYAPVGAIETSNVDRVPDEATVLISK